MSQDFKGFCPSVQPDTRHGGRRSRDGRRIDLEERARARMAPMRWRERKRTAGKVSGRGGRWIEGGSADGPDKRTGAGGAATAAPRSIGSTRRSRVYLPNAPTARAIGQPSPHRRRDLCPERRRCSTARRPASTRTCCARRSRARASCIAARSSAAPAGLAARLSGDWESIDYLLDGINRTPEETSATPSSSTPSGAPPRSSTATRWRIRRCSSIA